MRTVLVIDDRLPSLTSLCMILNLNGYQALEAENAQQAEQKFRTHPVDMLIVDRGLSGVSGAEIARQLKRIRNVLVVMLPGNLELKEAPTDVDLLLPKWHTVRDLLAAIEHLFQTNSA